MAEPREEIGPASWSDWITGAWLRRPQTPTSIPLLDASFEAMSRLIGAGRERGQAMSAMLSPAAMIQRLLEGVRVKLLRRPISVETERGEVTFILDELDVSPSQLELALGHLGTVRASAGDVVWSGRRVDRLDVTAKNVHVRPGPTATLVAAPVEVIVYVSQSCLDGWLTGPRHARLTLLDDTIAVTRRDWERWGSIEVAPYLFGSEVSFVPRAVSLRSRRIGTPRRLPPAFRLRPPPLPHDLVITDIEVRERNLVVTGLVPEIRHTIDPNQLQQFDRLARRGAGRFKLRDPVEDDADRASP